MANSIYQTAPRPVNLQYRVTRHFTGGSLEGLDYSENTTVKRTIGEVIDNPYFGSPYQITSCELLGVVPSE